MKLTAKYIVSIGSLIMLFQYSRLSLMKVLSNVSSTRPLQPSLWTSLVKLGIVRYRQPRRGSRAGKGIRISTIITSFRSRCTAMYDNFLNRNMDKNLNVLNSRLNIGVVERTPLSPKHKAGSSLLLCSANLQSVKSQGKSSVLLDYILKIDIDLQ